MLRAFKSLCCGLILAAMPPFGALAATVRVDYYENAFYLNLQFRSSKTADELLAMLTDYDRLNRINTGIAQSRVIGYGEDGKVIVWKKLHGCIAFVCRGLEHTELVNRKGSEITMTTLPDKSDFAIGMAHWEVTAMKGMPGSTLSYNAMLRPAFSLPPLLGPWLMKRAITRELRETAAALGDTNP